MPPASKGIDPSNKASSLGLVTDVQMVLNTAEPGEEQARRARVSRKPQAGDWAPGILLGAVRNPGAKWTLLLAGAAGQRHIVEARVYAEILEQISWGDFKFM